MRIADWPDVDPLDTRTYTYDFAVYLATAETVASVAWHITVVNGADAGSAGRLIGSPTLVGTVASHQAGTFVAGVTYALQAVATTTLDNEISLYANVTCQAVA